MANDLFKSVPVEMPNKSGFDMSHENFFTAKCGTLTPCLVDFLLPNDTVSVGFNAQIQLPPMATDFYGEVVGKYELFFVPYRILYGGWRECVAPTDFTTTPNILPSVDANMNMGFIGACSLSDYLGVMSSANEDVFRVNAFPFFAYHKIYDDWYRDARLTNPCFCNVYNMNSYHPSRLPWAESGTYLFSLDNTFWNGHCIGELWQRNFPKDYFTNATTQPQAGDPVSLSFSVDGSEGSFTIAGLRAANSLQMFMERNNIAGNRYQDRIKVQYGVYPSDAVTDRAIFLGSGSVPVYCKSVFQSADGSSSSNNPFGTVASKYGSSQGVGGGSLCKKFTATEHGILMCIFSLVPRRYYSSGTRRQFLSYSFSDIPFPVLSGVGDQEIFSLELTAEQSFGSKTFGYTQRYSEYKFMNNQVHGLLRDGESLSAFCLQSYFHGINDVSLSTSFIQIPTDFLDSVSAVSGSVSNYGCWNDTYFSYKKVSTLPAYSIPTLENMKFSHVENVNLGGSRL